MEWLLKRTTGMGESRLAKVFPLDSSIAREGVDRLEEDCVCENCRCGERIV